MPKSGDVIGDRYRLVSLVAEGGMGAVWRAEHVELGVEVALKVLLERAHTPSSERRFRQEAQAAARLRSPHVVQVQDFGVVEGQPFLVMELLEGEDLAARIDARGPLSPEACAVILDGVAVAIQLAHDNGIIHRDLKPANIYLAKEGASEVVKVLDFGIAKVDGSSAKGASTTGAGLVGSPAYMSPEQVWTETLTPATDLWSMGVVAFEMLVAHNPFDEGPLARVFQRIVSDPIPPIHDLRPGLPVGFDSFFERALARDPKNRFASARELAGAFRQACATEPASSRPPAPPASRPESLGRGVSSSGAAARSVSSSGEVTRERAETIGSAATLHVVAAEAAVAPRKRLRGAVLGAGVLALAASATMLWSTMGRGTSVDMAPIEPSAAPSAATRTDTRRSSGSAVAAPAEASEPPDPPASASASPATSSAPSIAVTSVAPTAVGKPHRSQGSAASPPVAKEPPPKPTSASSGVDPFFGIPQPTR